MLLMFACNQTPSPNIAANIATYLNNTAATRAENEIDGGENVGENLSENNKTHTPRPAEQIRFALKTVKTYFREAKLLDFSFSCLHQK
jgi:hypothetical protein